MPSARSLLRVAAHAALCAVLGAAAHAADADGERLLEARRLRDASAEDWAASKFAEAARKLTEAARIYEASPGRHVADLAVTRRALVWNLARAAEWPAAHDAFATMLKAPQEAPEAADAAREVAAAEIWVAYGAFLEAAKQAATLGSARDALEPVRARARAARRADLASQVLHDLGTIAVRHDAVAAAKWLEEAVGERREARAPTEVAYSLNNLARLHLDHDRLDAALPLLLEAHRWVTEGVAVQPQAEVAETISAALARLRALPATTPSQRAWLFDLAEISARSDLATVHRAETLLRLWLHLEARAGTAATRLAAATRVAGLVATPTEAAPEIRADLLLRAAALAVDEGGVTDALGWLGSIDVGAGPAGPHLEARRAVLVARARCAQRQAGEARTAVTRAREALAAAGDADLRATGLASMAKAARDAEFDDLAAALDGEAEQARGAPLAGSSASAQSGGDRDKVRALPLHGAVFEVRADAERGLVLRDEVTGDEAVLGSGWSPRTLVFHGLSLRTLGPYLRIESLAYGVGASASSSGMGGRELDALEPYLVVPGKGALQILKNGAVSYRR